jgi:hypothetical protein
MALFSGWNQLSSGLSQAASNFSGLTQTMSSFTGNLNQAVGQLGSIAGQAQGLIGGVSQLGGALGQAQNLIGGFGQVVNTAAGLNQTINSLLNSGGLNINNVGSNRRMISNSFQNVTPGAAPVRRTFTPATVSQEVARNDIAEAGDWRVSLSVPSVIAGGPILEPLSRTGNRMIFPFNPTLLMQHEANYTTVAPTHSNYPYHAYQNSQIGAITITGEFVNENQEDGQYYIAVLHFLRTMTKMYYGEGENAGNPPLISRLNGYGKHVLNDIPVVITNFSVDFAQQVDYIECEVDGKPNYVPVESMITITCIPNYSRRATAGFNLKEFAEGKFVGSGQGFI